MLPNIIKQEYNIGCVIPPEQRWNIKEGQELQNEILPLVSGQVPEMLNHQTVTVLSYCSRREAV